MFFLAQRGGRGGEKVSSDLSYITKWVWPSGVRVPRFAPVDFVEDQVAPNGRFGGVMVFI